MQNVVVGSTRLNRRVLLAASGLFVLSVTGCGGGGGESTSTNSNINGGPGGAPTDGTRARVAELHQMSLRGLTQAGFYTAAIGPSYAYSGGGVGAAGGTTGAADAAGIPMPVATPGPNQNIGGTTPPNVGAFLRNVAAVAPATRAARITASVHRGRQEPVATPTPSIAPGEPYPGTTMPSPDPYYYEPGPSFYFDYYLGLWVAITSTASTTTYLLYVDEAKTQPAGSIETTQPTDYTTFPMVFESRYSFTAGYSAGSSGFSRNTTNADYSYSSEYENVYADGWSDSGRSTSDSRGNYTWTSRTQTGSGKWVESAGSFRADGGGGTRTRTSEGYGADYTYNRDGSGRGRITGGDAGLPVTISWDAYGNTTYEYADGTVERVSGWGGYYYGGGYGGGYGYPTPIAVDNSSGSTEPAPPPTPTAVP